MSGEIVSVQPAENDVQSIVDRVRKIDSVVKNVFIEGVHYGWVGGKGARDSAMPRPPSLYQPGAQKFCHLFRLRQKFEFTTRHIDPSHADGISGHAEISAVCTLYNSAGEPVSDGVGTGSTMESRYRYKAVNAFEVLGSSIPKDYQDNKAQYRSKGFGAQKVDGQWVWVKYGEKTREPYPDPADWLNTVVKMAAKRALIHAVLNATGASDMFTQDVEDMPQFNDQIVDVQPSTPEIAKPRPKKVKSDVFGEKGLFWLMDQCKASGVKHEEVIEVLRQAHPDLPDDVRQWPYDMNKAVSPAVQHVLGLMEGGM